MTEYERAQNKTINWQTREVPPADGSPEGTLPTFDVFDPASGTVMVNTTTRAIAGVAVSDLKIYGNLNHPLFFPDATPTQEGGTTHG